MDMTKWRKQRSERSIRLDAGSRHASGKMVSPESAKALLEAVIRPGDRVCVEGDNQSTFLPRSWQTLEAIIEPGDRVVIEGDNQKQADFLAAALAKADPARLHESAYGAVGCSK